ncbi:transglycosylase SLT domain-containing protein [Photobacterium galatheae]|nr:transglycosylase SLT domain-containing protein [Photobacterium galatheae]
MPLLVLSFQLLTGCESLSLSQTKTEQVNVQEQALLHLSLNHARCQIDHNVVEGRYLATGLPADYTPPTLPELSMMKETSLWERLAQESRFNIPNDRRVKYYRQWYLHRPLHIKTVSKRAKPFLYFLYENVKTRQLPIELALLPFIESSFDPDAYSSQGAAGLWQMTKPTGKSFGLQINTEYDGRLDIVASTNAALDLLEYLHQKFKGNWLHAIAAYNSGESRVRKAIRQNKKQGKPTDFWSLDLPKETAHYVPKLLALSQLLKEQSQFNMPLAFIPHQRVMATITVTHQVPLKQIAKDAGISGKTLSLFNPAYTAGLTRQREESTLLIPRQQLEHFYQQSNTLQYIKQKYSIHHIEPGDSLYQLATLNNTSIGAIKKINQLANSKIHAGQRLLIPVQSF